MLTLRIELASLVLAGGLAAAATGVAQAQNPFKEVQVGPRPYYLVEDMDEGTLKDALKQCGRGPFYETDFSIGHRGAPLLFPEHTRESYEAAARQGAGIMECDVTFTRDRQLVCRHAQCDLHTTTNILATPLASTCRVPFEPADPESGTPARVECCTSDITLAEFKTLCGKMDDFNPNARTPEEYLISQTEFRTDLYSSCATLLSHRESIELFRELGVKYTPELKAPQVEMPFEGDYTQEDYAQQMIDEYKEARVRPRNVWPQSFSYDDILYWIENAPFYADQAVFLDSRPYTDEDFVPTLEDFRQRAADGLNIIAPPMQVLLTVDENGDIVPSEYARLAKQAGLDIITWTIERSGRIAEDVKEGGNTFYYASVLEAIDNDGDLLTVLDVIARQVGVIGIFTDWPGTVTYYANCFQL